MNLYLYGNCQLGALSQLILELKPDWDVGHTDVSSLHSLDELAYVQHMSRARRADVVISQPVGAYGGDRRWSLEALRCQLSSRTTVLTFPSIHFDATQAAHNYMRYHLRGFRCDYHNAHTLEMFFNGYHWDDIVALQASPEFYTRAFVMDGITCALAELADREARNQTNITVSQFIGERCYSEVVMNSINHPKRPVLAHVLRSAFHLLGVPGTVSETGSDYLPYPYIPPLPTVLFHLGFADDAPEFRFFDGMASRADHIIGSLGYYSRMSTPYLLAGFTKSRLGEVIEAYRRAPLFGASTAVHGKSTVISAEIAPVVEAVFRYFMQRPIPPAEVAAHVGYLQDLSLVGWLKLLGESEEYQGRVLQRSADAMPEIST